MDKVLAGLGKTGGNVLIDAPTTGKPVFNAAHTINDTFWERLDFFLIEDTAKYDYILCLVVCAADWLFG
ncbi:hypothetical protein [Cellvibrio mixtus]|uniref:hypothetical protein n=1 Tax=Cellvibrio mixtus TaxID=39650 RepID=UPI000587EF94|nr:hypothetical protein [Cellvibrio mixtus]